MDKVFQTAENKLNITWDNLDHMQVSVMKIISRSSNQDPHFQVILDRSPLQFTRMNKVQQARLGHAPRHYASNGTR